MSLAAMAMKANEAALRSWECERGCTRAELLMVVHDTTMDALFFAWSYVRVPRLPGAAAARRWRWRWAMGFARSRFM